MSKGALRGAIAGAGVLVVLESVVQVKGAQAVGGLLGAAAGIVRRCLDPTVAALPDHSKSAAPAGSTDANGNFHPTVPDFLGGGTTTAPGDDTSGQQANPDIVPYDPPPTGQQNPAYGGGPGVTLDSYRVPYLAPVTRNV